MKMWLVGLTLLVLVAPYAWSGCCNTDSPDCTCFVDGGSWDPAGTIIQDVALATLGLRSRV